MIELSEDQVLAIETLRSSSDKLFFLTGEAGTGKSTVIQELRKVKKVAPTGVAALLIGGTTIHRFLGIRPNAKFANPQTFFKRVTGHKYLVVDEISMVGLNLFHLFMEAYQHCGWRGKIIFTGDFAQLPPVKDLPCYKHPMWDQVKTLRLTQHHRQEDQDFLDVLSDVREANLSQRVKDFLKARHVDEFPKDRPCLASRLDVVAGVNHTRMMELLSDGREFNDVVSKLRVLNSYWDEARAAQDITKNGRALYAMRIFKGARMMTTRNEATFVNGTVGTVTNWNDDYIGLEDDDGFVHRVERLEFEVRDGDGHAIYTQEQFPLIYAWAITLHKSQGMTLEKAHVDLSNHFAEGQTYVGLSRLSSAEGLTVSGSIDHLTLKVLPNIPK